MQPSALSNSRMFSSPPKPTLRRHCPLPQPLVLILPSALCLVMGSSYLLLRFSFIIRTYASIYFIYLILPFFQDAVSLSPGLLLYCHQVTHNLLLKKKKIKSLPIVLLCLFSHCPSCLFSSLYFLIRFVRDLSVVLVFLKNHL